MFPALQGNIAGAAIRVHDEKEAERIMDGIAATLDLPDGEEQLATSRKGDPRKVICAALVKAHTSVKNDWLANRLQMGHPAAMGQLVNRARGDQKILRTIMKYVKTFKSRN